MRVVTLTGWGQEPESLNALAAQALPDAEIMALYYSQHTDIQDALDELSDLSADIIIGWSLGGQIACEAVARGLCSPKALILLGTAWQFVADDTVTDAVSENDFATFTRYCAFAPANLLKRFGHLIAHGDSDQDAVLSGLQAVSPSEHHLDYWLTQVRDLNNYAFQPQNSVPTLYIQGEEDALVPASQAQYFQEALPEASIVLHPACGHAPHLHNPHKVSEDIAAFCAQR